MNSIPIDNLVFYNPDFLIDFNIDEDSFIRMSKLQKSGSGNYDLITSFNNDHIPVHLIVQFKEFETIIEIFVKESKAEHGALIKKNDLVNKSINSLNKFTEKNFGRPTFLSNVFSKLNYPFYMKKWKYKNISVIHSFQDSFGDLYESLKFIIHK